MKKTFLRKTCWSMALIAMMGIVLGACGTKSATERIISDIGKEKKVDISDIVALMEKDLEAGEFEDHHDELFPDIPLSELDYSHTLQTGTDYMLVLPEYDKTDNVELYGFIDIYNAEIAKFNLWSDLELMWREITEAKYVQDSHNGCDYKHFYSKDLENAFTTLQAKIAKLPTDDAEAFGDSVDQYLGDVTDIVMEVNPIDLKSDSAELSVLLDTINYIFDSRYKKHVDEIWEKDVKPKERTKMFLNAIQNARSLDEQCAILNGWADNAMAGNYDYDMWIAGVAYRILCADRYTPYLYNVWGIWRCIYQTQYKGMSRDSCIPNEIYNDVRKRAFTTALHHYAAHTYDIYSRVVMVMLMDRSNIRRYGSFPFGNQVFEEECEFMYERIRYIFEKSRDEDGDEEEDEDSLNEEEEEEE